MKQNKTFIRLFLLLPVLALLVLLACIWRFLYGFYLSDMLLEAPEWSFMARQGMLISMGALFAFIIVACVIYTLVRDNQLDSPMRFFVALVIVLIITSLFSAAAICSREAAYSQAERKAWLEPFSQNE